MVAVICSFCPVSYGIGATSGDPRGHEVVVVMGEPHPVAMHPVGDDSGWGLSWAQKWWRSGLSLCVLVWALLATVPGRVTGRAA